MKLLITFNYFESEFLLKEAKILKEITIFKDKKQKSKLYLLELFNEKLYFTLLGMTQVLALPSLQKILDTNDIDDCLIFGSAGSYDYNIGKLVIINSFSYNNDILNKYFKINIKLPKWIKKNNKLPKVDIFHCISVNDIAKPKKISYIHENSESVLQKANCKSDCFDMESSEIAYLLKINKIESVFFRIITDFGEIDFNDVKRIYASQVENLLKYIEEFILV